MKNKSNSISRRNFIKHSLAAAGVGMVFPYEALSFDGKGQGSARIVKPSILHAGENTQVVIEFTVGKDGIPAGGGIWLGLHHAAIWNSDFGFWSSFQAENPKGPKFIGILGDDRANFDCKWYGWAPQESMNRAPGGPPANDWTGSTPLTYHQCLQAKVKDTPLKPGQKIMLTIGTREHPAVPPIAADKDHEFFIAVDHDGDGVFNGIGEYPKLDVKASKPDHLYASAQMTQQAGRPFELMVKAEDKYYNTATSFSGTVNIKTEQGELLLEGVKIVSGLARVKISVPHAGPQRLALTGQGLKGRSEPIMVFDKMPENRIFYGDMHGHTMVSDGCGKDAWEYYSFGRDEANLDVCALTDHWHYDWPHMQKAVKEFNEPGRFIVFLGEEAGTNFDHVNLYFLDDDAPHTDYYMNKYAQCNKLAHEQYIDNGYKVIGGPHHFAFDRGEKTYPWGEWDPAYARFAEIVSNHGTSEYDGNPNPLHTTDPEKTMQAGLAKGCRFGVIGSSDTHVSKPGRSCWLMYKGGLAAFVAPELTKKAIWDAWWNYRVYAAEFDRLYIDFSINGDMMGSEVEAVGSCEIKYRVVGADDGIEVFLIKNNQICRSDKADNGIVNVSFTDELDKDDNFYYLRAVQANGQRAWSTPVWVKSV
ncbi:hypothetical protein SMSP2_01068 [Limihaloglobus sulfuriphilus]|uniref:Histidinol phosphatase of the PHP family protein n=1 Tax=Limihaloglobus sulfuriphilus TaxID=1851148 RepID=A0A1Q2MDV0_9BACT|nr:twin-arginine translocation signal domain-containing protein [Limihaloglobus sulfuriphilus]AQQ70708.1 hypothetical protein SMSP2_01068 [Limihaloglobus sulfuriphilus]